MSSKNSPSQLVSGLGMGMAFLQALINEVRALGGFDEMIHYLSTERGLPTVKALAEVIVKSEWRIPGSLLQRLANEYYREYGEDQYVGPIVISDGYFRWGVILDNLMVPSLAFGPVPIQPAPIPEEIKKQIVGVPLRYPMLVNYEGREYAVCMIVGPEDETEIGKPYFTGDRDEEIGLAETKYFDFSR